MSGGVSSLSDADLMRMLGEAPTAPAAASGGSPLAHLSDAELMRRLGAAPAPASGPQTATDLAFGGEDPAPDIRPEDTPLGRLHGLPADTDAAVRGAADALTFGQADRIAAGLGAATGIGGTFGDYGGNLERERAASKAAAAEHPVATTAGKVGGTVAGAAGLMKNGLTLVPTIGEAVPGLLGRALGVGADGAAFGAAEGAGHAETLADVPGKALVGAGYGAAVGGALPVAGSALAAGYRGVAPFVGRAADGLSRGASQMLAAATSPEAATELQRLGPTAMLADASPMFQGLAEGVARKPGDGQGMLVRAMEGREAGRTDRLAEAVGDSFGPAVSPAARTAELRAQRTAETGPLFEKAFADAPPVDATPVLAEIGQRLRTARGPERAALQRAVAMLAETGRNGARVWTNNAEALHNTKTALDSLIEYGDSALGIAPGAISKEQGALKSLRGSLNGLLRDQVPGYGAANDVSAAFAKEIEAVEAGGDVLEGGRAAIWPADLDRRLAAMTPNERAGLFVGVRGSIENKVGTQANDLAALRKTLGGDGDWNREKLASLYGEEPTQAAVNAIDREARFARTAADVTGASHAGSRQAAVARLDSGIPDVPVSATMAGTGARVAQAVGRTALRAITGARSEAIRNELGDALSRQGDARDAVVQAILDAVARRAGRADRISGALGNSATAAGAGQLLAGPAPFGFSGR